MSTYKVNAVIYSNCRKNADGTFRKHLTITNKIVTEKKMYQLQSKFYKLSLNKGLDWFTATPL